MEIRRAPGALWLSLPIVVLGLGSSFAGVVAGFPYAAETATWAAQGRGQDAVNLAAFAALGGSAIIASRGSLSSYLVWLGLLLYSAYSYLIYAGFLHFGLLFPVYIATFGLSVYAFAWGALALDPARIQAAMKDIPHRAAAGFMLVVAALFYLLDLYVDLGAIARGTVPPGIVETGLPTDPVHILDMGLLLPAMILSAVSLLRRKPLGMLLTLPLLAFLGTMTIAIGAMFLSMWVGGLAIAWPLVAMFGLFGVASFALAARMITAVPSDVSLRAVLRSGV